MKAKVILPVSYFPSVGYFRVLYSAENVFIEARENYPRQTCRNRCRILAPDGPLYLTVPVIKVIRPSTPVLKAETDYSKRWQQVHVKAIRSCYAASPYYQFYADQVEDLIMTRENFLFDLDMKIISYLIEILGIHREINLTTGFEPPSGGDYDFRYNGSDICLPPEDYRSYHQVFGEERFFSNLSILDLIFNMGPESAAWLE